MCVSWLIRRFFGQTGYFKNFLAEFVQNYSLNVFLFSHILFLFLVQLWSFWGYSTGSYWVPCGSLQMWVAIPNHLVPLRLIFHLNLFPWKIVSLKVSFQLTTISNYSKHFKRRLTAPLMFRLKLVTFGLFVVGNDFTNIPSPQKMMLNVARIFFYSFFFSREPWKRNDLLDWSYWERPGSIYQVCINFDCWSEAKSSNLIIPFTGHTLYVKKSPLQFSIVV